VFYGSNQCRKDNPRGAIDNAAETLNVSVTSSVDLPPLWNQGISGRLRNACGNGIAWLIGLPRRAGIRLHAANDAEARWRHWDVTELQSGLLRQYRDTRFAALPHDPALRRGELMDRPCPGDR
jgi:hypothetical protein